MVFVSKVTECIDIYDSIQNNFAEIQGLKDCSWCVDYLGKYIIKNEKKKQNKTKQKYDHDPCFC